MLPRRQERSQPHDAGLLNEGDHHRCGQHGRHVLESGPGRIDLGYCVFGFDSQLFAVAKTNGKDGWLLAQPPEAFTIQLVTVSTAERAAAYLSEQSVPTEFATYRLERDGRELHVIVFGVYSTREEAQSAAEQLPASVGRVQPWIRSLAQVQRAIVAR